jgi:hypothetical protein
MKRRFSKVANFFAFNLLFFALYLNFIHKDSSPAVQVGGPPVATVKGTLLVNNPTPYLQKMDTGKVTSGSYANEDISPAPVKLSFN